MPVTFDAVGPSSAGASASTAVSTLSWTHTVGGGVTSGAVVVFVNVDAFDTTGITCAVTCAGTAMASLGAAEHTSTANGGYVQGFYLAVATTGAKSIVVTLTGGTVDNILGASLSFSGVTGHGSLVVKNTDTSPNITVAANTSGNLIAGALAAGSNITGVSGAATQRSQDNVSTANDTGSMSTSTAPATGSSVTLTWTGTGAGSMAAIAVEIQGPPPAPPPKPQALPGRVWQRLFRKQQYASQFQIVNPPPTAWPVAQTASATASALNPQVITVSAAAAPTFYPGPTWRKHFQWPQQQQLSGPPPLAFGTAQTATGTGSAAGPQINPAFVATLKGAGQNQYFTTAAGSPILLRCDTAWGLPVMAGAAGGSVTYKTDIDNYITTRVAQGFNAFYIAAIGTTNYTNGATNVNGNTWDGVSPFVGGNPGSLNDTYWQRVDYLMASAQVKGVTVLFNLIPSYVVQNAGGPLNGKTASDFTNYGTAVGNRYKGYANLIWVIGDDYFDDLQSLYGNAVAAIKATGDTHLFTQENYPESSSRRDMHDHTALPTNGANVDFNFAYSYNVGYLGIEDAYLEASPIAPIHGDGVYDTDAAPILQRNLLWWYLSSGARGVIYGREAIWPWPTTALAALTTNAFDNATAGGIFNIFVSFTGWHQLIPDTSSLLVTAGRGTHAAEFVSGGGGGQYSGGNTYVSASKTADGTLAVIYMPTSVTITVNTALMAAGWTATWFDPVSGAQTAAGTGPNFTGQGTNSVSSDDWVLVLQAPAVTVIPQVSPVMPGRRWLTTFRHQQLQLPPAVAAPGVTNAPAGLATATGTSLGQDTGANLASVAPNATVAPATGTARGFDTGDALPGVAYPPQQASPSETWRHFFQHPQQPVPPAPFNVYPATALATGTALGQDTGANIASVAPAPAVAAATGTSLGQDTGANVAFVTVNAAVAAGTGTALNASTALPAAPAATAYPGGTWRRFFQHPQQLAAQTPVAAAATNANAGLAAATGAALGATVIIAPNSAAAGSSGAALDATDSLATNGGTASATGSGQQPGPSIAIGAAVAAASGSALNASVSAVSAAAPVQALPGKTWLRQFHHQQQPLPPFVTAPAFTIGTLTASDTRTGVLTGVTASGGSGGVLTASDTKAGGPA